MKAKNTNRTGKISRLIVRQAAGFTGSSAPHKGRLHAGFLVIPCSLGRGGLTNHKREGDGRTPRGQFPLLAFYMRRDRLRRVSSGIAVAPIRPADGWCDDPTNRRYNRPVSLPFAGRHEKMWRKDRLYDVVGVLDYNYSRRISGRGSAIFFHVMGEGAKATEGCVAIAINDFRRLLPRLGNSAAMIVD